MDVSASAGSSDALGLWAYVAVFVATAAGYMGVPIIGTATLAAAAVFASKGELNFAAVLVVAAIGSELGGILGYQIGDRWGRSLLEHPGPALAIRKKAVEKGHRLYAKWGRAAVFFTPALVSGTLAMKFRQFVVWNFFAGVTFVLAVGPPAYAAGEVANGHHDWLDITLLVLGVATLGVTVFVAIRHRHRHQPDDA